MKKSGNIIFFLFLILVCRISMQAQLPTLDSLKQKVDSLQSKPQDLLQQFQTLQQRVPDSLNTDSLGLSGYKQQLKADSSRLSALKKNLLPVNIKQASAPIDSLLKKKPTLSSFKEKHDISGTINAGYDYGVIPFANSNKVPQGYFKTDGYAGFDMAGLPFNASYFYSTLKNISGLNNYFKISFDAPRFKEKMANRMKFDRGKLEDSLKGLYSAKLPFEKKMHYLSAKIKMYEKKKIPIPSYTVPDSLQMPSQELPGIDTAGMRQQLGDSLNKYAGPDYRKIDSLRRELELVKEKIEQYKELIEKTQKSIDTYKSLQMPDYSATRPDMPSYQKFFSNVKTLDVGLCYPNYSTFLVNGTALKGINFEYSKRSAYFAFTYGKTINNLLFSNNQVQNSLQNMKNLYNFFDFNVAKDARKIVVVKTGYGEKENTHFYVGLLYGIGSVSYLGEQTQPAVERNYAVELDGRIRVHKNHYIDLVYGKSYIASEDESKSLSYGFNHVFGSIRSNAFMGKYSGSIEKTKTMITLSSRWIDPLFKSFGIGFIRSDNFRYEAKLERRFGPKVKVNLFYRNDRDNLLNLYYYTTNLQNFGGQVSVKITKGLTVKAGYNPVLQHVDSKDGKYKLSNTNMISNLLVSWSFGIKKVRNNLSLMYNRFDLTSDTVFNSNFRSVSFVLNTSFSSRIKNNFTTSWFRTTQTDTMNNNTVLLSDEIGILVGKRMTLSVGAKAANNPSFDWQYGYLLRISVPLAKKLSLELSAEKLVIGDFYNSYNYQQVKQFPYFGSAKMIVNF